MYYYVVHPPTHTHTHNIAVLCSNKGFDVEISSSNTLPRELYRIILSYFDILLTVHLNIFILILTVHRTATYRCDDTRDCIVKFWPPDDEHIVLETCRGME